MFVLMMSVGMLCAQVAAGSNRPASVPSDYVITPFGYFHPSCVREIKEGSAAGDGRIQFENGMEEANVPFCNFPRYTGSGEMVVQGVEPPYISWDWIEAGQVSTSSTSYGKIKAVWTVPKTPTTNDGQTLFFFPGFEDIDNVQHHPAGVGMERRAERRAVEYCQLELLPERHGELQHAGDGESRRRNPRHD